MKMRLMRIMVVLRNIQRTDSKKRIEADYYPDGGNDYGHIVVDFSSGDILSVTEFDGIPWKSSAVGHARSELVKISGFEVLPKKRTVCWY